MELLMASWLVKYWTVDLSTIMNSEQQQQKQQQQKQQQQQQGYAVGETLQWCCIEQD